MKMAWHPSSLTTINIPLIYDMTRITPYNSSQVQRIQTQRAKHRRSANFENSHASSWGTSKEHIHATDRTRSTTR